jgi:hypothetical protein
VLRFQSILDDTEIDGQRILRLYIEEGDVIALMRYY